MGTKRNPHNHHVVGAIFTLLNSGLKYAGDQQAIRAVGSLLTRSRSQNHNVNILTLSLLPNVKHNASASMLDTNDCTKDMWFYYCQRPYNP